MKKRISLFAAVLLLPLMFLEGEVSEVFASGKSFGIDEINWTEQDWNSIAMTNDDLVTTGIVIRTEASEESGVEGFLYRGGAVNILDRSDEWSQVSSGGVTGYVRNEYIVRGSEARGFAAKYGKAGVVANWDDVKVFSKADADSQITGSLDHGTALALVGEDGKWLLVQDGANSTGFVSEEDVTRMLLVDTAVPVEKGEEEGEREGEEEGVSSEASDSGESESPSSEESSSESYAEEDSASDYASVSPALSELRTEEEAYEESSQGDVESYSSEQEDSQEASASESAAGDMEVTTVSDNAYVQSMYEAYVAAQNAAMHPVSDDDAYAKADEAIRAYQAYLDAANGVYSESAGESGSGYDSEDYSSGDSGSSDMSASGDDSYSGSSESSSSASYGNTNVSGYSDLDLLAGIIWCEAGNQPYEGMVAVGAVVMNRVWSGSFPNTIEGVLSQPGQFTPYRTGGLQNALANGVNSTCYAAAQDALNGVSPVPGALYFNTAGGNVRIGDHYFS